MNNLKPQKNPRDPPRPATPYGQPRNSRCTRPGIFRYGPLPLLRNCITSHPQVNVEVARQMQQESVSLVEFQRRFATEEACMEHLFKLRWPEGYHCPRCGHGSYCFHSTRRLYQCSRCKYQVSVTAGTIFHKTRTPLVKWFWMIFMMARLKSSVSMLSCQRMLGIKTYKTV